MKRGFSLAEVILAMGVLAVAVLAIAASVVYSTRMEGRAGRATQALYFANQLLDLSKLYNLPVVAPIQDVVSDRRTLDAPPFNLDIYANDAFRRNIRMTWLNSGPDYQKELYRIDVTVYWYEQRKEESLRLVGLHRIP